MAKPSRKSILNNDIKGIKNAKSGLKLAAKVENSIHSLERSGLAGMAATSAGYKQMEEFWKAAYAKGGNSYPLAGADALNKTLSIGQGLVETWHKIGNDLLTMYSDALECRSIDELYNLQRKTATMMIDDWTHEMRRANCGMMPGASALCPLPMD